MYIFRQTRSSCYVTHRHNFEVQNVLYIYVACYAVHVMLYILDACGNLCLEPWSDIGKTPIKRLHHGGFINLQVIIIVRNITFIWPLKTLNINVERWIVWVQRQRGIAKFTRIAMKGIHRMLKKKITLKGKITWILLSLAENPPPLPQAINNDRSLTLTKKIRIQYNLPSRIRGQMIECNSPMRTFKFCFPSG